MAWSRVYRVFYGKSRRLSLSSSGRKARYLSYIQNNYASVHSFGTPSITPCSVIPPSCPALSTAPVVVTIGPVGSVPIGRGDSHGTVRSELWSDSEFGVLGQSFGSEFWVGVLGRSLGGLHSCPAQLSGSIRCSDCCTDRAAGRVLIGWLVMTVHVAWPGLTKVQLELRLNRCSEFGSEYNRG